MTDLTVRKSVPAPPERVWRALTTPELAVWFWPPSWNTATEIDLQEGHRYHLWSDAIGMGVAGEYLEIDAPVRLRQAWRWDGEGDETTVTMTLEPDAEGTLVTVLHEGFPDAKTRDEHIQGWNDCLERLPAHLAADPAD